MPPELLHLYIHLSGPADEPLTDGLSDNGFTILWSDTRRDQSSERVISLPDEINGNPQFYRDEYLSLLNRLRQGGSDTQSISAKMAATFGHADLWWQSLVAEKCSYAKSPQILDILNMLALIKWAGDKPIGGVTVTGSDPLVVECIGRWCNHIGASMQWQKVTPTQTRQRQSGSLRVDRSRWLARLPKRAQAMLWLLKYCVSRWAFRKAKFTASSDHGVITLFSYFGGMSRSGNPAQPFNSHFWGELPGTLDTMGVRRLWLHQFVPTDDMRHAGDAMRFAAEVNATENGRASHHFVESFLSVAIVVNAVLTWIKLGRFGNDLARSTRQDGDIADIIYPLLEQDWLRSTIGYVGLENCLLNALYKRAIAALPQQKIGLFLQENLPAERALLRGWRMAGHGTILSVPHSTVRFWDLRYFFGRDAYAQDEAGSSTALPLADQTLANGGAAWQMLTDDGMPEHRITLVEALRYNYLHSDANRTSESGKQQIIIFGEYTDNATLDVLCMARDALLGVSHDCDVIYRPHPLNRLNVIKHIDPQWTVSSRSLAEEVNLGDIAIVGFSSSVALDAYLQGAHVITVDDAAKLPLSPLLGVDAYSSVTSHDALVTLLQEFTVEKPCLTDAPAQKPLSCGMPFFNLNPSIPLWRNLLSQLN